VAVLGAGAWGTALACLQAGQGHAVRLWARRPEFAAELARTRENEAYLPGVTLPEAVEVTGELPTALAGAAHVIVAVPSHALRDITQRAAEFLARGALVICATKGLERPSGLRMSEVLTQTLDGCAPRLVALSGPNLSAEIIAGQPAVSVAASAEAAAAREAQELLSNSLFRVYTNCDMIGVELCGAIKNVIAIGAGISDGLGFGNNAKAALLTRGMAEIRRLGLKLGAQPDTFAGIAGMGDLIATCHSPHSRNWRVGYRLGQGERPDQIASSLHSVAEGIVTTFAVRDMARTVGVEMPIAETLAQVLAQETSPAEGVKSLMTRRWRAEEE